MTTFAAAGAFLKNLVQERVPDIIPRSSRMTIGWKWRREMKVGAGNSAAAEALIPHAAELFCTSLQNCASTLFAIS